MDSDHFSQNEESLCWEEKNENSRIRTPASQEVAIKLPDDKTLSFTAREKWTRFKITVPLIPLRLAIFFWYGGGFSASSFITMHFKKLGLTVSEMSVIYTFIPASQLLGSVVSGTIADKIGNTRSIILCNIVLTIVSMSSMMFIPERTQQKSSEEYVQVRCIGRDSSLLNISQIGACSIKWSNNSNMDLRFELRNNVMCYYPHTENSTNNVTMFYIKDRIVTFQRINNNANIFQTNYNIPCQTKFPHWCDSNCDFNVCRGNAFNANCRNAEKNNTLLLVLSSVLITSFQMFYGNVAQLLDVLIVTMAKSHNSNYGREFLWAMPGIAIFTTLSCYVLDVASPKNEPTNYLPYFYFLDGTMFIAMIAVWKTNVKEEPPGEKMLKKTMTLLKNPNIVIFMVVLCVAGTTYGYKKMFSFLYLEELQASSLLLGMTIVTSSLVSLPFLYTSDWWLRKIGSLNLIILCLVGHTLMSLEYSFLINPWWALPLEFNSIFSFHLLWVAIAQYSKEISPPGLKATVLTTAGGLHNGVGKGLSSLIGGSVMSKYGARVAFRVLAGTSAATATLYTLYLWRTSMRTSMRTQLPVSKKIQSRSEEVQLKLANEYLLPLKPELDVMQFL